jgi:ABC-type sugar transport system substrate-binding protein
VRTRSTMTVRTHVGRGSRVLLTGAMVVLVAACGSSGSGDGGNGGSGKSAADLKIAFIGADGSQNFAQEMMAGAQAAGDELGVDVQVIAPTKLDGPAQVKMFEDAMRTATDGIAIETLTPDLLVRAEARAVDQKIPVVAVDTTPLPDAHITTYVGNDNLAAGGMLADAAIEQLKAAGTTTGKVVVGNTIPGVPVLDYRAQGMAEAFAKGVPGFTVVGPQATAPDPTANYSAWANLVSANSDASVFMGTGDSDNGSLARINRDNDNKYLTGAFDLTETGLQAVKDGVNFASADPQHFIKGYIATRLLIENALGKNDLPEGWWVSGAELVTKDNVDEILARQENNDTKLEWYRDAIDKAFANPPIKPMAEAK